MAERDVIIPGARTPLVDRSGRINPTWLRFFVDLHERTGGGASDKVEAGSGAASDAQAAADSAQNSADAAATAAATAQSVADEIERRIDFDFEIDLR